MGYPQEGGKTSGKSLGLVEESPKEELGEGLSAANISRSWSPSIWVLARGGGIRISHLSVIYIYIYIYVCVCVCVCVCACVLSRFSCI